MHIAIVGPANAAAIASRLYPSDAELAAQRAVNYGSSVNALSAALSEHGHRVTLITHFRGQGELQLFGENFTFHQVSSLQRPRSQALSGWKQQRIDMVKAIQRAQPDVVHGHWTYEYALSALESGLPAVITARDAPLTVLRYKPDVYRLLRVGLAYRVRARLRPSTIVTAVSPHMASAWRQQMWWRGPIDITPNITGKLGSSGTNKSPHPVIVDIGNDGRLKNIPTLLKAFKIVRSKIVAAELQLIGPSLSENGRLARWARSEGLSTGVAFLGELSLESTISHLSEAWIHAHASLEESFGNTILEAMSSGTLVVGGHRSGAVPWLLADGAAGLITNVRNPSAFASAIEAGLSDPQLRAQLTSAATRRLSGVFSAQRIVEQHIGIYQRALAQTTREN